MVTRLSLDHVQMPTADVGPVNPLPPLFAGGNLDKTADMAAATDEIRANAGYGRVSSICPYLLQDSYTRERAPRAHRVAVLENEHLRATFLLDAGGRLWSLLHKATGRDLLFANPVFQPANLALRNAWFAGGVEWNIGTIGHTPLTCAPVHAARVRAPDATGGDAGTRDGGGYDVLRLYEFERIRRVVYQLDMHLPPDSQVLYVHVRITNPHPEPVPMYWWSNIAVPQRSGTRVIAPADSAWNYSYDNVMRHEPVVAPDPADTNETSGEAGRNGGDGVDGHSGDISYPAHYFDAADFFFDLDEHPQPWIAAVQSSGDGLFQTSTSNLRGRKLFRWGTSPGGRRWQRWLTGTDDGYAEIQAGLARTQFEHLRMPAGATWSWTEGYGRVGMDAAMVDAPWPVVRRDAERLVTSAVPPERLAQLHARAAIVADRAPDAMLHDGSGWGALECRFRDRAGEPVLVAPGTPFPDHTLGSEQQPWLDLLESGELPELAPDEFPASLVLHPAAMEGLRSSPGWTAPALLGAAAACAGDLAGARAALSESLGRGESAYARRNLAVIATGEGDHAGAAEHYRRALRLAPGSICLVIEALRAHIAAGRPGDALALVDTISGRRVEGRIRLLEATAALAAGELDRCGAVLNDADFTVADLREGEDSLNRLWWEYRTRTAAAERGIEPDGALRAEVRAVVTVPPHLDFRMHTGER